MSGATGDAEKKTDELNPRPLDPEEKLDKDTRPWWKRMKRETGKVKDPFGKDIKGVKWSVKGDSFLYEVMQAVKSWFR